MRSRIGIDLAAGHLAALCMVRQWQQRIALVEVACGASRGNVERRDAQACHFAQVNGAKALS